MLDTLTNLLALAGGSAVIIAAIAGFSYWLFKLFSEKWLTGKFNERLEAYKHRQQRELEELRFKINALMDRTMKLHQREFDVLPEAWSKLVMAHGHVYAITLGMQQVADLDRMTSDHLDEFLEKSPLDRWEKEAIKREPKKTDYYTRAISFNKAFEARSTYREFYVYFRKNGIFIRHEIKIQFDALCELIHGALVERELELQHEGKFKAIWESRSKLAKEGDALMKRLEEDIQNRLWDSQSGGPVTP